MTNQVHLISCNSYTRVCIQEEPVPVQLTDLAAKTKKTMKMATSEKEVLVLLGSVGGSPVHFHMSAGGKE